MMTTSGKRILAARLLLSVFVPMLLLMSLHQHQERVRMGEGDCYECANHLAHGGHLQSAQQVLPDCVLCQMLSVSYDVATVQSITLPQATAVKLSAARLQALCLRSVGAEQGRAPPCFLFA